VHFGNRNVTINPPYETKLLKSAREAKRIEDYDIQVGGYAATIGSVALNQQISEDRADSVATFLVRQGDIPLANLIVPGAMGQNLQVGDDKIAERQAQNQRVVVRILQNKGIAGLESRQ